MDRGAPAAMILGRPHGARYERVTSTLTASPTLNSHTLQVDGPRKRQRLMELARIGAADKDGICRLALSDLDRQARAETPACLPSPPAATSTPRPTGGKFDGNYGVLAGLKVLPSLSGRAAPRPWHGGQPSSAAPGTTRFTWRARRRRR